MANSSHSAAQEDEPAFRQEKFASPTFSAAWLMGLTQEQLLGRDLALDNLLCAIGLPGTDSLHVQKYIDWLDNTAHTIEIETGRNYYKYLENPDRFANSQARFCMVCLVTVLQTRFGVKYNPKWEDLTPGRPAPTQFGSNANDLFIHAIVDGIGGTCGSLPVLYVAVGRRLGYPLKLVKAHRHLFVRWDDPGSHKWHQPEKFNIEATGPGVHFLTDDHYRRWPQELAEEDIAAGIFLKSLSRQEELAEFLAARAYCLRSNGKLAQAAELLACSAKLFPANKYFYLSEQSIQASIAIRNRGHLFLNSRNSLVDDLPEGPFWITESNGTRTLMQICNPRRPPRPQFMPISSFEFRRQIICTPSGTPIEVFVPTHEKTTAHWLRLPDGSYALVHRQQPRQTGITAELGRCRSREAGHNRWPSQPIPPARSFLGSGLSPLDAGEQSKLVGCLEQFVMNKRLESQVKAFPEADFSGLTCRPNVPRLPICGHHTI